MDRAATEQAVKIHLSEAARIAKAADACAQAGSVGETVTVAMDTEQMIHAEAD